jgi:hypothetical protein
MRVTRTALSLAGLAFVVLAAACGEDDGGSVRDLGGSASSGSGSGSGSGSATGASGSASGSAVAHCEPVGDASAATTTLDVTLAEWSVTPDGDEVPAGTITFAAANEGEDAHELVIVRADDIDALPTGEDGTVAESQLPEGAFIGEIEAFPSGETCDGTFELEPATYALFCNIIEEEDGELENHFELGMRTLIEVTG